MDTVTTETREVSPGKVKSILNKLCDDNILKIIRRSGLSSYRFFDTNAYSNNDEDNEEQRQDGTSSFLDSYRNEMSQIKAELLALKKFHNVRTTRLS